MNGYQEEYIYIINRTPGPNVMEEEMELIVIWPRYATQLHSLVGRNRAKNGSCHSGFSPVKFGHGELSDGCPEANPINEGTELYEKAWAQSYDSIFL